MGKQYTYTATSLIYVFVFFSIIFGLVGLLLNLCLCRPNTGVDPYDVSKSGCCMTQMSCCSSMTSIWLLSFLGKLKL